MWRSACDSTHAPMRAHNGARTRYPCAIRTAGLTFAHTRMEGCILRIGMGVPSFICACAHTNARAHVDSRTTRSTTNAHAHTHEGGRARAHAQKQYSSLRIVPHTHAHTDTRANKHTHSLAWQPDAHMYAQTRTHALTCSHTRAHTHKHTHTRARTHTHTCMYASTHTHTHVSPQHVHMHTGAATRACKPAPLTQTKTVTRRLRIGFALDCTGILGRTQHCRHGPRRNAPSAAQDDAAGTGERQERIRRGGQSASPPVGQSGAALREPPTGGVGGAGRADRRARDAQGCRRPQGEPCAQRHSGSGSGGT